MSSPHHKKATISASSVAAYGMTTTAEEDDTCLPDSSFEFSDEDDGDSHELRSRDRLNAIQTIFYNPKWSNFYQEHCTYLPAMLGWFLFSALLSGYNKKVFGKDGLHFPCPLLLTSIHFSCQWAFGVVMCKLSPEFFGSKRVDDMSWREYFSVSIPCGCVTAGDVGLSNLSLVSITLTFYTMVKASTPIFVLLWAYFFGIMRITWQLCGVVFVIAVGEYLTVVGEVDFVLKGFLLCLMASILSGMRWTLIQLKIQKLEPPLKSTVATMRVLSPFMMLTMLLTSFAIETPWSSLQGIIDSWGTAGYVVSLGLLGACLAICMIMCEFYLIMHSNAIVLMIGGVIKEILTIFIGINFFGDTINLVNFLGCCVVFMGVVLYKFVHHYAKEEEKAKVAVAISKSESGDDIEYVGHPKRRDFMRISNDESERDDSSMDGFTDDEDTGKWIGIEMRRKKSGSGDALGTGVSEGRII